MQISAKDLAQLISGRVAGNGDVLISAPAKIEEAGKGDITFLANPKYEEYVYSTKASVVLVAQDFTPKQAIEATLIHVEDVYKTLAFLLEKFGEQDHSNHTISDLAFIHESAQIDDDVTIGPFCIIEKNAKISSGSILHGQIFVGESVTIGGQCVIHSGVKIYRDCLIGNKCILHSNAVIGSDGFGFQKDETGAYKKVPQIGKVVLHDNVDIGANTVIDRATMGSTVIGEGAKLDNLIQIAHNVEVGANTVIAAQTGIAGSTKIGQDALIGGQVGIVGHIQIADKTMIQAGSGINKSIKEVGAKVYGYPALPYTQYLRSYSVFKELPEMRKRLALLEKKLNELENQ